MFTVIRNAWKIADLRKKMLFTLFIILVFRIGSAIPVPYIDSSFIQALFASDSSSILVYLNMLTGGALAQATVFALSISPYINASIIIQLLTVGIPALERLSKSGDEGRKKLAQYTRYLTVGLSLLTGFGYYKLLQSYGAVVEKGFFPGLVIVLTFTAGSCFLMWLAEKVADYGIGNGISILLFAGIVSRLPAELINFFNTNIWLFIGVVVGMLILTVLTVYFNDAERRISVQYAKRVVGRKQYGGQAQSLPIKVLTTGVLPVIFASAIVSIPGTISSFVHVAEGGFWSKFFNIFSYTHPVYGIIEFLLIIFFGYFYAAVQFNPVEIANNIKNNGGFVTGIRPGKPTSDYISKIMSKVILIGSLYLGLVAVIPMIFARYFGAGLALGGTSLLIVVGVALETVGQIESQMLMRHYKSFLE